MATYLVFEPQDGARTAANAERVVFLREKFSSWAFILTPFWLLRYRLWLGFLIWLAAFTTITVIGGWIGYGPYAAIAASFFPSLIFGMEAVNLRTRKLLKSGYRDAGVVIAEDLDTAEQRFFEGWNSAISRSSVKSDAPYAPKAAPLVYPETKSAIAATEQNIIGMFPTSGQR